MNDELKLKCEKLKERNKKYILKMHWNRNVLLQECLHALGKDIYILSSDKNKELINKLNVFISVKNNSYKKSMNNINDLLIDYKNEVFYIIWDEKSLPIVRTDFSNIIQEIESITAVSFDTWLIKNDFSV